MGFLLSLYFFLFLLQVSSVVSGGNSSQSRVTPIKYDLYHSSGSLLEKVTALVGRHPDILSAEKVRAQNKGYSAEILVVTYSRLQREIDESSKFRILLTFGQHGRELITSEVAFRLLTIISGDKSLHSMGPNSLNAMLDKLVIKVVPMENLNGRKLVEAGDLCERRNGRAVDLNRNWSVDWGKKEEDFNPYEENPGTAPFSEPETQIMRRLSRSFNPHLWVNVHSGMEALFMPYDHRNTTPNGLATDVMRLMLEELNHHHCHGRCLVGSGGGSVGYLAHGTSTDYMYDVVNIPLAFTFEIYGDLNASSNDCFKMFNPTDTDTFNRVLNDWCGAFFMIFERGPNWLGKIYSQDHFNQSRLVSMNSYIDSNFKGRKEGSSNEMLDFGMQELRTYFRLFMLSSALLLFMFCSRISKSKYITGS